MRAMISTPSAATVGISTYPSLKRFVLWVFCFAICLYAFFGINNYSMINENSKIFTANVVNMICYFLVLGAFIKWRMSLGMAIFVTIIYSIIFSALNLYLFWDVTGEFFEFTGSDSYAYHQFSVAVSEMGPIDGIRDYLVNTRHDFDDAGFVFYLSAIYWLTDSIWTARLMNILLNAVSVYLLYNMSKRFLADKLAMIASISYGIASFTIYYQSSGLKETVMITLILLSYHLYYHFADKRTVARGILFISVASSLMFFRIPLALFILLSACLTEVFSGRIMRIRKLVIILLALLTVFSVSMLYQDKLESYTRRFATPLRVEAAEQGLERPRPSLFMRSAAVLAGVFGPFPSVIPLEDNRDTVMHGPGLVLKTVLSIYFMFGFFIAIKRKNWLLLPLILFCLMHIVSLSYLVHTFKLRNVLPYFPFFFLIAFYGFQMVTSKSKHVAIRQTVFLTNFFVMAILFFWNFLRF